MGSWVQCAGRGRAGRGSGRRLFRVVSAFICEQFGLLGERDYIDFSLQIKGYLQKADVC